jgi:formylmethanofuran dehydrogenase subunit E
MSSLQELLDRTAALHQHLCPRQVLGVQMGRYAAQRLNLSLPQTEKRLLTIVETDGCFADGVAVSTNCWVGRRTMRVEDYGKVAATFVDTQNGRTIRLAPHPALRKIVLPYAPDAGNKWQAMLLGYQRMEPAAMFVAQAVALSTPIETLVSRGGLRATCDRCGEEIINAREVLLVGLTLCRACAEPAYYRVLEMSGTTAMPT